MGLYISNAFFYVAGGGALIFGGGGLFSWGLIPGVKAKLRNAWAYTRGKNSC